jgi:hypothetical protein
MRAVVESEWSELTHVAAEEVAGLMLSVEHKLFYRACSGFELRDRRLPIWK